MVDSVSSSPSVVEIGIPTRILRRNWQLMHKPVVEEPDFQQGFGAGVNGKENGNYYSILEYIYIYIGVI